MNKVYCKDCKHKGWEQVAKCWDGSVEDFLGMKLKKCTNENNDCPHYQRRWWKFWRSK